MLYHFNGELPEGVEEQVWYRAESGSDIRFSESFILPDEVKKFRSGTAYEGYGELCELFNNVVDAYAQS